MAHLVLQVLRAPLTWRPLTGVDVHLHRRSRAPTTPSRCSCDTDSVALPHAGEVFFRKKCGCCCSGDGPGLDNKLRPHSYYRSRIGSARVEDGLWAHDRYEGPASQSTRSSLSTGDDTTRRCLKPQGIVVIQCHTQAPAFNPLTRARSRSDHLPCENHLSSSWLLIEHVRDLFLLKKEEGKSAAISSKEERKFRSHK